MTPRYRKGLGTSFWPEDIPEKIMRRRESERRREGEKERGTEEERATESQSILGTRVSGLLGG